MATASADPAGMPATGGSLPGGMGGVPGSTVPGPASAGTSTTTGGSMPPFSVDMKRLTSNDRLVGVSAILLFISLFLPWFDVSDGIYSGSGSGLDAHGYLYIPLILTILVVLYLVARAGFAKLPFQLPISHELLLRVVTIIDAILVVIGFIFKPSGGYHVNVGWDWGAFVALIVALSPFYWRFVSPFIKAQMAKRSQTSASHTGTTN